MTRAEVLEKARVCVCGEREQDYGTPEDNFKSIGFMWTAYLNAANPKLEMPINGITAKDVAAMMVLLKVARIATGSSPDSFIDAAGYAACAGEVGTEKHDGERQTERRYMCASCVHAEECKRVIRGFTPSDISCSKYRRADDEKGADRL